MGFLNLFSNDQQLSEIDKQIEGVISSVPVKEPGDNSSEESPSEMILNLLAAEDRFADKETKKNSILGDLDDKKQSGIMSDVGTLLDRLTVQADRASRYKTYEEIYSTVPIIKKMMDVWISNLMQKNPVSGRSLIVKDAEEIDEMSTDDAFENKKEAARVFVDEVLEYFSIIDKLKCRILPTQTMYGDAFIELINVKAFSMYDDNGNIDDMFLGESSIKTSTSKKKSKSISDDIKLKHIIEQVNRQSFSTDNVCEELSEIFVDSSWDSEESLLGENLAESYARNDSREIILKERKESKNLDSVSCFFEYVQNNAGEHKPFLKIKNNSQPQEIEQPKKRGRPKKEQTKKEKSFEDRMLSAGIQTKLDLSSVLMLIHDPKNIVILHTPYGTKLGYVEVAEKDNIQSTNINQQLNTIIGKLVTSSSGGGANSQEEILSKLVKLIVKKIIEKTSEKSTGDRKPDPEKILNALDPSIFNTIKKLIIETDKDSEKRNVFRKLKARFIPITRMFHFTIPANEYYPYGRSFIDPLVLQAKLYILSQLANTIMKLSRAAPIRKWIVDVGATQGQSRYIQQLKRDMYNQRVTIDNVLSFKSMPKILSDFKDIAVYRKGGVSHLDMEVQSLGDASVKTQDLEDSRRELIALSGVPAPYLGYGDVVELQSQLVHVNLNFATTIADVQETATKEMNRMLDTIADMVEYGIRPSAFISVGMVPPVVLMLQLIEMTSGSANNILGVFQSLQLPVDPIGFLKKYVPYLDWEELEEQAKTYTVEHDAETEFKSKSDARLQAEVMATQQGQRGF